MAVTLNALTTGVGGLQTTGDTSGAIQLQSNGTATLTVDSSGNVGIGVATIQGKFNVGGGRSNFGANSETYSIAVGYTQARCNSGQTYYIGATDSATPDLVFSNASGTERLRIASTGEIGLGGANYGTSGQFLTSNGPGAAASWTTAAAGGFSNMQVFTGPGTFTTPSTTTKIKVTVVGGGGAGATSLGASNGVAGGGGGGGAIYVGPVTASTPYAVTVGSAGGTSSFGVLASATGGSAGSVPGGTNSGYGGAGGAGSAGTLQFRGNGGNPGVTVATAPAVPNTAGGAGGGSLFGGGGAGVGYASAGNPGQNYGGGGSGGTNSNAGGTGAAGVVIVEF